MKNSVKRACAAVLICIAAIFSLPFMAAVASAATPVQSAKFEWTVPTTRESGEALPASEIKGYELTYRVNNGKEVTVPLSADAAAHTLDLDLPASTTAQTIEASIVAVDTFGLKSKPSNSVRHTFMVLPGEPSPPANFRLVIECRDCTVRMAQ